MLELKTKNSHDHGTNAIGASSLPIHSSSLYSRVEDFVFLFYVIYIHFCILFYGSGYIRDIRCRFTMYFILLSVFIYFFIHSHIHVTLYMVSFIMLYICHLMLYNRYIVIYFSCHIDHKYLLFKVND